MLLLENVTKANLETRVVAKCKGLIDWLTKFIHAKSNDNNQQLFSCIHSAQTYTEIKHKYFLLRHPFLNNYIHQSDHSYECVILQVSLPCGVT